MKKTLVAVAAFIAAAAPTLASATEEIAVFDNLGGCNSAWTHLNNEARKADRKAGNGHPQDNSGAGAVYYCAQRGDFWVLIKL